MSWTDERVALLKKLWCEGKTAAEIATELGGITRNAVIGKAHRLKLSNRVSPIQQDNKKAVTATVTVREKVIPVIARPANMDIPISGKGVKMTELKDRMCRWPLGDPRDVNFHFCGCQAVPGLPYCPDHAKVAYQAASRNRVLQAEDFEDHGSAHAEDEAKEAVA
jgi:GcrA cell cycle regulator